MLSATTNPQVVDEYLEKEVRMGNGQSCRPNGKGGASNGHVNKFGVIEKPHQPG